ncbi:hypothetical protein K505DRAFT_367513 [Melanomma pulvis-pyrius CBS 109.77]|uniref:Uncharacterized protein n=1 Tax=Melanomma pulvis-pyrius CBS 109.77 TaxID=1314802 RepID=A0A6A6WT50_9PLEO|nr:hypothetical protein K505DRAFT_367513 [Melanomma pulvis-pyrius CBS 109.77]
MAPRKNQLLSTKIASNWKITDIKAAIPIQLRPRVIGTLTTLIPALHDLSAISKGRMEEVHGLLRDAVLHRRQGPNYQKAEVNIDDIKEVEHRLRSSLPMSESSGGGAVQRGGRKGKRKAVDEPIREKAKETTMQSGCETRAMKRARLANEPRTKTPQRRIQEAMSISSEDDTSTRDTDSSDKVIPETPPVSPPPNLGRHSDQQTASIFPEDPEEDECNVQSSSPSPPQLGKPASGGDAKEVMNRIQILREILHVREVAHQRLTDEYVAKTAEYQRRALVLKAELKKLETQILEDGEKGEE